MGSLRGSSGKYAACGWAVVNMDLDGGEEPWYGVAGTISSESHQEGRDLISVQAGANCVAASHKDADL